jgi:hypothetical protein
LFSSSSYPSTPYHVNNNHPSIHHHHFHQPQPLPFTSSLLSLQHPLQHLQSITHTSSPTAAHPHFSNSAQNTSSESSTIIRLGHHPQPQFDTLPSIDTTPRSARVTLETSPPLRSAHCVATTPPTSCRLALDHRAFAIDGVAPPLASRCHAPDGSSPPLAHRRASHGAAAPGPAEWPSRPSSNGSRPRATRPMANRTAVAEPHRDERGGLDADW